MLLLVVLKEEVKFPILWACIYIRILYKWKKKKVIMITWVMRKARYILRKQRASGEAMFHWITFYIFDIWIMCNKEGGRRKDENWEEDLGDLREKIRGQK